MTIILDKYKNEKESCIDFVQVISESLNQPKTPDYIILQLFNFLVDQKVDISYTNKVTLLDGFCKSDTITDESESEVLSCIDRLLIGIEELPIQIVK